MNSAFVNSAPLAMSWSDEILRDAGYGRPAGEPRASSLDEGGAVARITEIVAGRSWRPEWIILQGGRWRWVGLPAKAFLIETETEKFLWDTGYSRHFFTQATNIYRLFRLASRVRLGSGEDARVQLERSGTSARELTSIVVSHFHTEQVAGLADFTGLPVYASPAAWRSIENVSGLRAVRRGYIPALVPAVSHGDRRLVDSLETVALPEELYPFTTGFALSADRTVIVVDLPGHASGQIGAFVKTLAGWELIASDAAWDAQAFSSEKLHLPSSLAIAFQDDRAAYVRTLERLQTLHRKGIRIRLSHGRDPAARGSKRRRRG